MCTYSCLQEIEGPNHASPGVEKVRLVIATPVDPPRALTKSFLTLYQQDSIHASPMPYEPSSFSFLHHYRLWVRPELSMWMASSLPTGKYAASLHHDATNEPMICTHLNPSCCLLLHLWHTYQRPRRAMEDPATTLCLFVINSGRFSRNHSNYSTIYGMNNTLKSSNSFLRIEVSYVRTSCTYY